MEILKRSTLGGLATVFLLLPAIVWLLSPSGGLWAWSLSAFFVAVGALLFVWYFRVSWSIYTRNDIGDEPTPAGLDVDPILTRSAKIGLSSTEVVRFTYMLIDPTRAFQRITETVEPMTRSVGVTTTATLMVTGLPDETVVVPLVLQRRGVIQNVRFFDDENRRLSSLSTSETTAYILAVVRQQARACGERYLSYYLSHVERDIAEYIANPVDNRADSLKKIVGKLHVQNETPDMKKVIATVSRLLSTLMLNYPLCIAIPLETATKLFKHVADKPRAVPASGTAKSTGGAASQNSYSIRVSARIKSILEFHHQKQAGLRHSMELIRGAFGILPTIITVPLANAARAQSYHLHVAGPDRTYLAWQSVLTEDGKPISKDGHLVAAVRRGQRHGHLYTRQGFGNSKAQYRAQFYERMPGSMAPAALSAFSVAILVWLGLLASKQTPPSGALLPSFEYATLVLAFPAAISIWVGVDGDRRLLAGVLAARVSTLCTIAIAVTAATLNIVTEGQQMVGPWIALGVAASVNALVAMYSWAARAWLQWWFTRREAPKLPVHDSRAA